MTTYRITYVEMDPKDPTQRKTATIASNQSEVWEKASVLGTIKSIFDESLPGMVYYLF